MLSKEFDFNLVIDDKQDFDIIWHSTGMKTSLIKRLKNYQRYNHFPGMYQLAKKTNLGRNLMKMSRIFANDYNFFPKTWILPTEFGDFLRYSKHHENKTYIVKPDMNSQGKGIYLTKSANEVNSRMPSVVQEYVDDPFLVDDLKFDIRIYVLILSVDPLRVFLFDEGLVRFATVPYQKPTSDNIENTYIHLTNYAINKFNKDYEYNEGEG